MERAAPPSPTGRPCLPHTSFSDLSFCAFALLLLCLASRAQTPCLFAFLFLTREQENCVQKSIPLNFGLEPSKEWGGEGRGTTETDRRRRRRERTARLVGVLLGHDVDVVVDSHAAVIGALAKGEVVGQHLECTCTASHIHGLSHPQPAMHLWTAQAPALGHQPAGRFQAMATGSARGCGPDMVSSPKEPPFTTQQPHPRRTQQQDSSCAGSLLPDRAHRTGAGSGPRPPPTHLDGPARSAIAWPHGHDGLLLHRHDRLRSSTAGTCTGLGRMQWGSVCVCECVCICVNIARGQYEWQSPC